MTTLLRTLASLLELRFRVENTAALRPGPVVVLFRHASIIDNLLPYAFITGVGGPRLRWILKKELLTDPALDIGGHRMPNYFVDRGSADPEAERSAIRALASDLGPDEGALIFPEGTRFSESRRKRALERLRETDPELHRRARNWRRVLPPAWWRPGPPGCRQRCGGVRSRRAGRSHQPGRHLAGGAGGTNGGNPVLADSGLRHSRRR